MTQTECSNTYQKLFELMLFELMTSGCDSNRFESALLEALSKGFPIDFRYNFSDGTSKDGNTLLHASMWINQKLTQRLLDNGADVNVEDHNGMNVLLLAVCNIDKFVVEEKGIVPRYFAEIIEKTKDLNKIPHHLVDTTAFGLLCRTYCVKQDPVILPAIRMLLDAGADIDAGGDWAKVYSGPDDKKYYEVGEKLKAYTALYVQQKENLKETQEAVTYEYEI